MYKSFFIFLFFVFLYSSGQNIFITGLVTDQNKEPLEGVQIISETNNLILETKTNSLGEFRITLPDTLNNITFNKIGYNTFKTTISDDSRLTVTLEFSDLLAMSLQELLKTNVNTVTLKEEKITDAPGIVTIITGEDLKKRGFRTVREALSFIPGFTAMQNDDEQILSMQGIFATSNQKILFLRNGHSLNEGNLDIPQMEYSISIENIKKIEVIRGPGGSIYGNSAFAAVVNIITVNEEGTHVKVTRGNYGQLDLDGYICKKISKDSYFLSFARYAGNKGEKKDVDLLYGQPPDFINGTYYANHYTRNYDAGFIFKTNIFSTSLSFRRHHYQTYWTVQGDYTNVDSLFWHPGLLQNSIHYDFTIHLSINENSELNLQNYIDYSTLTNSRLLNNIETQKYTHGRLQVNEWNVMRAGMNYYAKWDYGKSGSLITGLAFEDRKYLNSWILANTRDSSALILSPKPFFPESNEIRGAIYIQAKYSISSRFKLDIGTRYDFAEKYNTTFNPRLALVIYPFSNLNIKLIYTKAFQAPGYSYRYSNAEYSGSMESLQPEIINTLQGLIRYHFNKTSFLEISVFNNRLNNIITRIDNKYYSNYGKMASYGIEAENNIELNKITLFGSYALLLPDTTFMDQRFKTSNIYRNKFKNMPEHTIISGITYTFFKKIDLTLFAQYTSSYYSLANKKLPDKIIANSTLRVKNLYKYFGINVSIYNLTNQSYMLGDPSMNPVIQAGRWFTISFITDF